MGEFETEYFDTEYTRFLVCPWCGHGDQDSWEVFGTNDEDIDVECDSCGKPFRAYRHIDITYSSEKI